MKRVVSRHRVALHHSGLPQLLLRSFRRFSEHMGGEGGSRRLTAADFLTMELPFKPASFKDESAARLYPTSIFDIQAGVAALFLF